MIKIEPSNMEPNTQPTSIPEATPVSTPVEPQAPVATTGDPSQTVTSSTAPVTQATVEPTGDSFTNFDPNALTDPNLQTAYKQMQADYTRKMQEISQKSQQYSKYEQYAPILDAMSTHQPGKSPVSPVVDTMVSQLREAGYDDPTIEVGKTIAESILNHIGQEKQVEQQQQFVTSQFAEAVKADPRLEDPSLVYDYGEGKATFGEIVEELVAADPNWSKAPLPSVQRAIKKVDAMINTAKTQGKQELSQQTTQKAQNFAPVQSSPQGATSSDQAMSIREAFEAAKKSIGQ